MWRTSWYSPATSAVMYVDIGCVGSKAQRDTPSPSSCGSGVGELETTFQCDGAVTRKVNGALRSGCSKVV